MKEYKTLLEWQTDVANYRANPNDDKLLARVVERLKNSTEEVRKEVHKEMYNYMLDKDPWRYFEIVMKDRKDECVLFVKSEKDPWFEC